MADAKCYDKAGEHVIIPNVRTAFPRPIQATDWTDLRVGFFLSLTKAAADDDPAALSETIGATNGTAWTDRLSIGVTDRQTGQVFCGYTNLGPGRIFQGGNSQLVSSDIGIGTTNTRYWRPKHERNNAYAVAMIDSGNTRATVADGSQPHFVQDPATAGGYCTLLALRFTRDNPTSRARIITMQVMKTAGGHSSDVLFTTTPTPAILQAQLQAFPPTVATLGPVELTQVPDTLWCYWPFHNSRLRVHCHGILKTA